jgi:hypothetical protein
VHHANPYFVIVNALPKLQKYFADLTAEQRQLYVSMSEILVLWKKRLVNPMLPLPGSSKQDQGDGEGSQEDKPVQKGEGEEMERGTGTGKAMGHVVERLGDDVDFHYDSKANILAWIDAVNAARLPKVRRDEI